MPASVVEQGVMPPVLNICEEIHAPCNDQLRVGGCHGKIRETSKKRTLDAMQSDGHMTSRKTVEDTPDRTSSEDEQQRRDNPTAHCEGGGVEARPRESLKPPVATKKAKLGKVKTAKKAAAKPEQERRRKRKAKDSSASAGISQASAKMLFQCSCEGGRGVGEENLQPQRELEEYADEQPPSETASMSVVEAGPAALRASGEQVNPLSAMANAAMLGATAAVESSLPPTVVAAEAKLQEELRKRTQKVSRVKVCIHSFAASSHVSAESTTNTGMAWHKNRRASSASSSSRSASSAGRGGRRPPGEPAEQTSRAVSNRAQCACVWRCNWAMYRTKWSPYGGFDGVERQFEARRGVEVTRHYHVRVDLLECGLNSWQNLVELQRLLPTHRVVVRLASAFVEWGNSEIDNYRWEGKHVWTQLVVEVPGEERDEIQRVFLPPVGEVATDTLAQLRYPELDLLSHPNKLADHVTLFYRPNKQYTRDAELGAAFPVRGVEVVQDEHAQTLRVELDERLPLQRVITTSSPFGVDANCCSKNGVEMNIPHTKERLPDKVASGTSRFFVLYVNESDLMRETEEDTTSF
ncbi:hypothetical protein GQ600_14610 [Phytophthora cactorum]|nr:hypothetical protein GQ600_14610 [Phytophthora cactorum]